MITMHKKRRVFLALFAASFLVTMATVYVIKMSLVNGDVISASGLTPWHRLRSRHLQKTNISQTRLVSHFQQRFVQFPQRKKTPEWTMENIHKLIDTSEPMSGMILHFVWCGRDRFLDYRNYLSIKSAVEVIQPAKIMLHYLYLPMKDPQGYFSWLDQLRSEYSNLVLSPISRRDHFYANSFAQYAYVFQILRQYGGIFVPEDSLVLKIPSSARNMSFVSGIWSCKPKVFLPGMVLARKDQFEVPATESEQVDKLSSCDAAWGNALPPCAVGSRYQNSRWDMSPSCVHLATPLFPRDLWPSRDRLSAVAKVVAYNRTELEPRHISSANERTPRVAHYLCGRNCTVTFTFFLSILSALHVAGLDHVMIHGPSAPSGEWWERLQLQRANSVHFLQRYLPPIKGPDQPSANEMRRYIARTEILMQYGGVFHDSHVIWTQALPEELLEYEAVVSPDWRQYGSWPDSVNHDVIVAAKNATYLDRLLKMYREKLDTGDPWFVDRYLSYRLKELDPTLVHLHPRLQMRCVDKICHSKQLESTDQPLILKNTPGYRFDWRRDAMSVQWEPGTAPDLDVEKVRFSSEIITEIAEHVLTSAGEDVNFFV